MQFLRKWVDIKEEPVGLNFGAVVLYYIYTTFFGFIGELINFRMLPAYIGLILLIPFLATGMRRMQDAGKVDFIIFILL
jgi:uncharacterized membrane protein YhaH (DUF805 family)